MQTIRLLSETKRGNNHLEWISNFLGMWLVGSLLCFFLGGMMIGSVVALSRQRNKIWLANLVNACKPHFLLLIKFGWPILWSIWWKKLEKLWTVHIDCIDNRDYCETPLPHQNVPADKNGSQQRRLLARSAHNPVPVSLPVAAPAAAAAARGGIWVINASGSRENPARQGEARRGVPCPVASRLPVANHAKPTPKKKKR